jgi:hypothetical protein
MADIFKTFETDLDAEVNGETIQLTDEIWVSVARSQNTNHRKALELLTRKHRAQIQNGTIAPEVLEEIANRAASETLLLDWGGIDVDGKKLPYSIENAYKLLSDPRLKDFREQVFLIASEAATFRKAEIEEAAKNSAASSPGT